VSSLRGKRKEKKGEEKRGRKRTTEDRPAQGVVLAFSKPFQPLGGRGGKKREKKRGKIETNPAVPV